MTFCCLGKSCPLSQKPGSYIVGTNTALFSSSRLPYFRIEGNKTHLANVIETNIPCRHLLLQNAAQIQELSLDNFPRPYTTYCANKNQVYSHLIIFLNKI